MEKDRNGTYLCGDPASERCVIKLAGEMEIDDLEYEYRQAVQLAGGRDFCLLAVLAGDWNDELSPWTAPAIFGDEAFGGHAQRTLDRLLTEVIPDFERRYPRRSAAEDGRERFAGTDGAAGADGAAGTDGADGADGADRISLPPGEGKRQYVIGGYSLAGLFALWAATRTDLFYGVIAASPSVWFPGWLSYAQEQPVRAQRVYLSLGDREERSRNQVLRTVGDCIRQQKSLLEGADCAVTLEWNRGNHFADNALRCAKGIGWMLI